MGTLRVTSDIHFGHRKLAIDIRGFPSIEDHDEYIVDRWNRVVSEDDTVLVLGDISLKQPKMYAPLTRRLHGFKHLVYGNHDPGWGGHRDALKYVYDYRSAGFITAHEYLRRRIDGRQVLFSHFPYDGDHGADRYTQYRLRDEGVALVHGHTHSSEKVTLSTRGTLQIHVGMDAWSLTPVSVDEIVEILRRHDA